jgi:signal transduction histidine kinase
MLHSIRVRLLLTVGVLVLAALAAVGLMTSRVTERKFEHFLTVTREDDQTFFPDSIRRTLYEYHRDRGTWEGVDQVLIDAVRPSARGRRVVFVAKDERNPPIPGCDTGRVVVRFGADTMACNLDGSFLEPQQCESLGMQLVRIQVTSSNGEPLATVIGVPPESAGTSGSRREFLGSVNQWLLLLVLGVGILAIASTFLLSRRILHPVEELTMVAREMGRGDLSRRVTVRSKDEIGELASTFNTMADGLARIERLRRNMVEDVAHELRTPITNIRCHLEGIQDGLVQPSREVVDSLHEDVLALSRLIETLQDLALAEAGQLRLAPEPTPLGPEVDRVVRSLSVPGGEPLPAIRIDLPADCAVNVDRDRFRQILRNLLTNAVTHTPAEGSIAIEARTDGPMVEIRVRDTGEGIPQEDLPFVFERFYRVDPSRQRATGGVGLGLAIARQLVESHGGRIRVESQPGEGTTFAFTLPAAALPS